MLFESESCSHSKESEWGKINGISGALVQFTLHEASKEYLWVGSLVSGISSQESQ